MDRRVGSLPNETYTGNIGGQTSSAGPREALSKEVEENLREMKIRVWARKAQDGHEGQQE